MNAGDLKVLAPGNFLVIHHGEAGYQQRTVDRTTPHGADTPTLEFVPDSSDEVKSAVSSLGESLKKLLEQQAQEESEMNKLKRDNRALETKNVEQAEKLKMKLNLADLLHGGGQVDQKLVAKNEELTAELVVTKKDLENSRTDCKNVQGVCEQLTDDINKLSKRLPELQRYEKFGEAIDLFRKALNIPTLEHKMMEVMSDIEVIKKDTPKGQSGIEVIKTKQEGVVVEVERDMVQENDDTMKGKIAMLILEEVFEKPIVTSTVISKLKDFYPGEPTSKNEVMSTLYWFSRQRILEHNSGSDGSHHKFKVIDKSRIIVKEV